MLGILGISACTGLSEIENTEETTVKKEVTITATHEFDYQTKTVLQEDGSVWWKPNDAIGVFFGTYCSWFVAYNMEDAPTANFIGEALIVQGHNENSNGNAGEYTYWGVFPPNLYTDHDDEDEDNFSYWTGNEDYKEPTREKESVNVYLPAKQKGVAGTFDKNLFISIAKSNTYKELSFYNLCGGLAFCVEKEGIHTVTFKGNADEVIAGGVNVVVNSDNHPVVNEVRNGKKEVKLTMPKGEYFVPGEWYYIVMLPTSLEEGYSMTFYTDREMGTVVSSKPVEIKRSVFGKLTNPDSGVEYTEFIPVESVKIRTESYCRVNIGDTLALTAVITPSDCTFPAAWSSSDPSVATVDENGNVVGVSEGEARIILTVGDMSDYILVYVSGYKVPSFTITSIDLTDVYAITEKDIMYEAEWGSVYRSSVLYKVTDDGVSSPLTFNIETDDPDFAQFVQDDVLFGANAVWFLTEKYLVLEDFNITYNDNEAPEVYRNAIRQELNRFADLVVRLTDGTVLAAPNISLWRPWLDGKGSIEYQQAYYNARESYDGQSVYFQIGGEGFGLAREVNDKLEQTIVYNYEGSQFLPNTGRVLLDKNNNMLTYSYGEDSGYILCDDNRIVPFEIPHKDNHIHYCGVFFEVDYAWYYWSGSRYYWEDHNRYYATLYKVELVGSEVVFTEVTNTYSVDYWEYYTTYYRRGNTFIFGYYGNYVVIDMDKVEVSHVRVNYHDSSYITPEGYYYDMQDGVLYKYDLLSGEPTMIQTDRSQVPPMTPTTPYYDETNHCYYETGVRLSDSVYITVVTDPETGKVVVYEGKYENSSIYVKLP